MSTIIKAGGQQAFQYRGELIPNEVTITKAQPGPEGGYFRVASGKEGWTLYGLIPAASVNVFVNWPSGVGTVFNDTTTEIEVSGDGLFPV